MKNILSQPKSAAIAAIILILPMFVLTGSLLVGFQPNMDPVRRLLGITAAQPDVLGMGVFLAAFLMLLAALWIDPSPIIRLIHLDGILMEVPVSLFLAAVILGTILAILRAMIADQYPCWAGVPNCDLTALPYI